VTEHPNARRMRHVADAVARGDFAAALAEFPDDVVWFSPATRPEDRVHHGRDGLMRFFGRLQERASGTVTATVVDVLGSDNHVVIFLRVTATRDDKHLCVLVAHFATVGPGGFTRNWFLPSDAAAWNRFFR
jgi:ketosteroid isomerase-like protein